jgi:hypothetical protein
MSRWREPDTGSQLHAKGSKLNAGARAGIRDGCEPQRGLSPQAQKLRSSEAQGLELELELTLEFAMPPAAPRSPNAAVRRSGDLANAEEASTRTTHPSRTWRRSDYANTPSSKTNGRSVAPMAARRPSVEMMRTGDRSMRTRDWTRQHDVQVKQPLDATTRTRAEKTRQRLGTHRSD